MNKNDTLQRFMFKEASIRGEIVHLTDTFTTILHQRPYPPLIKKLLGEALISCLLLVGSIKFEGELTLQFQSDDRLPLLLVQCNNLLQVRAFAKHKEALSDEEYTDAFLKGKMVLTINQYKKTTTYQSIVPIDSLSMADNLMHYFFQSEQISSQIWLAIGPDSAAGMLLQLMPGQGSLQREQFWEYAIVLGQSVQEEELLHLDNETLLHRLYHETPPLLFDPRSVRFQCRCNEEKMRQVFTVLGEEETTLLLKEREEIEVHCDFCNNRYTFDAIDVALLFHKGETKEKEKKRKKKK